MAVIGKLYVPIEQELADIDVIDKPNVKEVTITTTDSKTLSFPVNKMLDDAGIILRSANIVNQTMLVEGDVTGQPL